MTGRKAIRETAKGRELPSAGDHAKTLAHWTEGHNYWRACMSGEKPPIYNDAPCLGFYRKPIREKAENGSGRWITKGHDPVAVFFRQPEWSDAGSMIARVGNAETGRDVDGDELNELWGWIAQNAISEEWYDAVARRGEPWPDEHRAPPKGGAEVIPTTGETVAAEPLQTPEEKLQAEIDAALAGVAQYAEIDSDEKAARAQSLRSGLTRLKGDIDKMRVAEKEPHLAAGRAVDAKYQPMVKAVDSGAAALRGCLQRWEDTKREAERQRQKRQAEIDAQHAKDAEWAKAGNEPAPPAPEQVKTNTPAPAAQIKGASGRTASVSQQVFCVGVDVETVIKQFAGNDQVVALLTELAQKAKRAGLDVAGATFEVRSIVR